MARPHWKDGDGERGHTRPQRREFVIGGYTEPQGSRVGFGALLLGYYDDDGRLQYAGKVGTGFNDDVLQRLGAQLEHRECLTPPFAESPGTREARTAHWVRPELVAEIEFSAWTEDGRLRHPTFQGLRDDTPAESVTRDPLAGLTHPERVLYPEQGLTKRQLAEYYGHVAELMLPHVTGRPLSLLRCPRGRDQHCFFQRHAHGATPAAIDAVPIRDDGKTVEYLTVHKLGGLIALAQLGVLELHPWSARADDIEHPDRLVIDLDPGEGVAFDAVREAAREVKARLDALGLTSFLKATGGKGLHVVVPFTPGHDWSAHKAFAKALARAMARDDPRRYVATASKTARRGRVYIDYLRNARGASAIAPYSTRARAGAPVAMPLRWEELERVTRGDAYSVARVSASPTRSAWEGFFALRQSLTPQLQRRLESRASAAFNGDPEVDAHRPR